MRALLLCPRSWADLWGVRASAQASRELFSKYTPARAFCGDGAWEMTYQAFFTPVSANRAKVYSQRLLL